MDTLEIIEELKKRHPRKWVQTLSLLTDEKVKKLGYDFNTVKEFVFADVGKNGLGLTTKEAESLIVFNIGTHKETSALEVAGLLGVSVGTLGRHGTNQHSGVIKNKNDDSTPTGNEYRIAKLKRDFGEKTVMEAIEDNGYTKATNQIS